MSTRCQIHIEESKVYIYKHCDGYPEGVLPKLIPFVKDFLEHRGWDESYLTARIVAAFINDEPDNKYLSYGVDTVIHGDIEYLYEIRREGMIEVRTPKHSVDFDIIGWITGRRVPVKPPLKVTP